MATLTGTLTPFMGSVTATTTAQSLYDLLSAIRTKLPHKCCYLAIQVDPAAGGGTLYIGNSDVTSTMSGVGIFATTAQTIFAFDSNLIVLDHIYLLASTGEMQVNITVVCR